MTKRFAVTLMLICLSVSVFSQSPAGFSLTATPRVDIPLGPVESQTGSTLFGAGGGVNIQGNYALPFFPYLVPGFEVNADFLPFGDEIMSMISVGGGLGISVSPVNRLNVGVAGFGGLYAGIIEAGMVRNPYYGGGGSIEYLMSPSSSLRISAAYTRYTIPDSYLYDGISVSAGISLHMSGSRRDFIEYRQDILPVFPLFYSFYDENSLGEITLHNTQSNSISDVDVRFYVRKYMDQPKLSASIERMRGGSEVTVPLYALFTDEIFKVTEGDTVAGEIIVSYTYVGKRQEMSIPVTVDIHNRNALTWDDDNKAAAFITAKDPAVLTFGKNIAGMVRNEGSTSVSGNFRVAMGIFTALEEYGLAYVPDPATPYDVLSENPLDIDYVQFPVQTLAYRAGDCDDLSILYAALLESVGIETALVTAPGHIYLAFNLGMAPEEAKQVFAREDELIFRDDQTWMAVEITLVGEGFNKAWQIGAKEWRVTAENGTAGFFPVRSAWETFEPVGFAAQEIALTMPNENSVLAGYTSELERFVLRQIEARVSELEEQIRTSSNNIRYINRLGVLYARFGLLDRAADQFELVVRTREYGPALVNLGHIAYIGGDFSAAYEYYQRALAASARNSGALLGLAKAAYELEQYDTVESALAELEVNDPETAQEFSYLSSISTSTARASQAATREVSGWETQDEE